MEKKKSGVLRPISWLVVFLLFLFAEIISTLLCRLGVWGINFLSEMTNFQIVITILLVGGTYTSLVIYALITIPMWIVSIGDKIYPSNHAFRYYFFGVWELVTAVFVIINAISGVTYSLPNFWIYARSIYMIVQTIIIMITAREKSNERHEANEK